MQRQIKIKIFPISLLCVYWAERWVGKTITKADNADFIMVNYQQYFYPVIVNNNEDFSVTYIGYIKIIINE